MEKKTIGTFLAALRKANGMTQQEVADKLNVSNKTVSKWERDEGCPEVMMLPAIAELYSVTVDEILRGERVTKIFYEEQKNKKSEERIKFLAQKASVKFTNNSIIAIILGVVALILSYTISDIVYDYNVLWIGYVIILLLTGASLSILLISANNLVSNLQNNEIIEEQAYEKIMKKCVRYVLLILFLSVVTLLGLILNIVLDGPSFLFIAALPTSVVGGIVVFFVYKFLYKKFNIPQPQLSEEQKIYRKKHIKVTAIIISAVIVFSVAFPFVNAFISTLTNSDSYCFADGVGHQYSTMQEAKKEYSKLKGYITEDRILYRVIHEEYSVSSDECVLYYCQIGDIFEKTDKGYRLVAAGVINSEEMEKEFASAEEMEKFKAENVYDEGYLLISELHKNVTFDDDTFTVNYKKNTNYFSGATDILGLFIIIGSAVCLITLIASVGIYYRKQKVIK